MSILPPSHFLFQMANSFLLVSYVSTNILFLRICLALASLCFALWGGLILNVAIDTVIWNTIFFAINSVQAAIIVHGMIPITFDQPELETIYTHFFEGDERSATLSRNQFKPLADMAQVMIIPAGTIFAGAGTVSDHLSLLLTGEMVVIRHRSDTTTQILTQCHEFDFLDSPEWIARKTPRGSRFEVTIKTKVACRIVRWSYAELERCMKSSDGTLRHTLNSLIGQDLANKVFASNRSIWTTPDSPHVIAMRRLSNPIPRIALTSNSTSSNSATMEHVYSHSALANEGTEREQSYSQPPDIISQHEPSQSQSEFDAIVVHGDEHGIYGSFGNTMSSSVTTAAGATTSKDYKN